MAYDYKSKPTLSKITIDGVKYFLKDAEARVAVDSILADYLKAADKSELQNLISSKVSQSEYDAKIQELVDEDEALADLIAANLAKIEALQEVVGDENSGLVKGLADEITRATAAEGTNATNIANEITRATNAEEALDERIDALEAKEVTIKSDEKILAKNSNKELYTTLTVDIEKDTTDNKDYIVLKGINDALVSRVDASQFMVDGMIESATYNTETHILTLTFNTAAGKSAINVDLSTLVDTYEAGDGLTLDTTGDHPTFKVVKDSTSENYLSVSSTGIKVSGIDAAIETAVGVEETRATNAEEALGLQLNGLETRVSTAETDIDTLEGKVQVIEAKPAYNIAATDITAWNGEIGAKAIAEANDGRLDVLEGADTVVGSVAYAVKQEATRAAGEESRVEGLVSAEETRAKEAEDDLDTRLKTAEDEIDALQTDSHTHSNKTILDNITAAYTSEEATKLAGIEAGAEVNIIEGIKLNGSEIAPVNKVVDLGNIATTESVVANVSYVDGVLKQQKGSTTTDVHTFGDLADENLANLEVKGQTISGVKASGTSDGELTGALGYASTQVDSTGVFTATGSIDVQLSGNTFNAITGVGTLPSYTDGSFSGGKATVIDTTKFSGGSKAADTFTQGSQAELTTSNINYIEEGVNIAISDDDEEELIISRVTAKTAKAVDTFTANALPTFNEGAYTAASLGDGFVTAGTDANYVAPVYVAGTLPSMEAQTVSVASQSFTGTANQTVSVAGNYDKANLGTVAFSGKAIELNVGDIVVSDKNITKK